MIRLTFLIKVTYKRTRIESYDLLMNFKPTEILSTPTFDRSLISVRVKRGFSN